MSYSDTPGAQEAASIRRAQYERDQRYSGPDADSRLRADLASAERNLAQHKIRQAESKRALDAVKGMQQSSYDHYKSLGNKITIRNGRGEFVAVEGPFKLSDGLSLAGRQYQQRLAGDNYRVAQAQREVQDIKSRIAIRNQQKALDEADRAKAAAAKRAEWDRTVTSITDPATGRYLTNAELTQRNRAAYLAKTKQGPESDLINKASKHVMSDTNANGKGKRPKLKRPRKR